ncbi:MAG: DedA family protein [Fervidicoccaceae archaeon]
MVNYSTELILRIGYIGIFILMTLESALIPIPSEVVMTFSGFLVWRGQLNLVLVILAGTLGNLLGAFILYKIGSGPGLSFVEKYGKYFLISEKEIERARNLFIRYGNMIVFSGRMMPAVRTVVSLPAGIAKMKILPFLLLTLVGSIPWNAILTYLGYLLGENWIIVENYARTIDYAAIIIIILLIAGYFIYIKRE